MKALIKAAALMLAGAALLLAVEAAWIFDAFIVKKADADARRQRDEVYSLVSVNPADEFAGLGDGEWSK